MDALDIFMSLANCSTPKKWKAQRLGKLTASRFGDMMQKGKDSPFGTKCLNYIYETVAAIKSGKEYEITSKAMAWGTMYEQEAKFEYEDKTRNEVQKIMFVPINEFSGATPDGLIEGGIIEIKCPFNPGNHQHTVYTNWIKPEYILQIQGGLLATGRDFCDFVSYDPRIPDIHVIRVERDDKKIDLINDRLSEVWEHIKSLL